MNVRTPNTAAFLIGEVVDGGPLGLDAEPRTALARGGNAVVGDSMLHSDKLGLLSTDSIPPFAVCT